MNGICLARRECNNLNGTITGTCASRRGRCCVDFLDLVLAQPDGDGVCSVDSLTITGGNTIVPILCGDNTGQTIFVDFNGNAAITITISATLSTTFSRRWNIKLTQLGCDCPGIAPNGCLQYYTGTSGTINSFNYATTANPTLSASLVTGTRQLANLNYGICIRMEAGYCSIQYAQASGLYSFTVTGDVEGADSTVLGTDVGAVNDGDCTTDFVVIPNPFTTANVAVGTDRFCGLGFVTVTSALKPFVLYVVTDGSEGATATTPPDVANRGFSLTYSQIAC
ncbi:unnamed protein product [Leptidea sinapis]|uniref:CUB domain-containing protein n=1 Tax=Leptidea sinapis TaxID=189913 RepID=A0A5E4PMM1_9NEOP|nr:unnamed protein product [Leptidea sinapis]